MMMTGEVVVIALREAVIVNVIEAVMEGDHLVLIVEKGEVLIMAVGPAHIRERGAALTMVVAVTVAVAEVPFGESELALHMGVEALVHIEERGRLRTLFVTPAVVLITKSVGELTMEFLLPTVLMEE